MCKAVVCVSKKVMCKAVSTNGASLDGVVAQRM